MHRLGKPLGDPKKEPGTRLANEYHGGNFGKLIYEKILEGERFLVLPRMCMKCLEFYETDGSGRPFCPVCGEEPGKNRENAPRMQAQSEELNEYKKRKGYKRFRRYSAPLI